MIRKRILISGLLQNAGGVESHLLNLCRVLIAKGADVTLATRAALRQCTLLSGFHQIPVRLVSTPFAHDQRWFRLSTAWAMAFWPLQLQPSFDVLYSIGPPGQEVSRFTRFLARFLKKDGYAIANRVGFPATAPLRDDLKNLFDAFVAESPLQAEAARKVYRLKVPVAAIPLLGHYDVPPIRAQRKRDQIRVAFLGRYDRGKGLFRLLDLWAQVAIQPARLDYYGDGPDCEPLKVEVRRRGLAETVCVNPAYGGSRELAAILENTDLVLLPSDMEGLPVVLLEAMAHGVPFVATDVGAVRTLAEDNPDVRVVPLDNAALACAIEEIVGCIRAGTISGVRLQDYHRRRYSRERVARLWSGALLEPELFWANHSASARQANS